MRGATLAFSRGWGKDHWLHAGTAAGPRTVRAYYQSVEGKPSQGTFESGSYWRAAAPQISRLAVAGGPALHPVTASTGSANLDGTGRAVLVDAKSGTPDELAAAGVKGRIALVDSVDVDGSADVVVIDITRPSRARSSAHREAALRDTPVPHDAYYVARQTVACQLLAAAS